MKPEVTMTPELCHMLETAAAVALVKKNHTDKDPEVAYRQGILEIFRAIYAAHQHGVIDGDYESVMMMGCNAFEKERFLISQGLADADWIATVGENLICLH